MSHGFKPSRSSSSRYRTATHTRLGLERLECRDVPATLAPITDFMTPDLRALSVPLTVTNASGAVNFNVTSSDPNVQAQLVTGGTTIKLSVTGKDSTGQTFSDDLILRLFDNLAPVTTARIVTLVDQGFYNGLTFHRILKGFVAQGGDPNGNGTGGSGVKLDDEFSPLLTFNSPGMLAMANSGDDTSDSQFFITDLGLPLSQEPQFLDFNFTIFGQLVAGFDTFEKLINTPVQDPNVGNPVSLVTITSASVVQNDPDGVLRITAPSNFTGTSTITVTPTDGSGAGTPQTFHVTFVPETVNDPPFLGPVANQTTTVGTGVTFTLTSTDLEHDPVTYSVISATSGGNPINVQSKINQATGQVTVTPPAGFVGTIDLKVGVQDATASAPDTQVMQLTVSGSFDLEAGSDTGALSDDNVTGDDTPTLTVLAPTGQTVAVTVNGTAAGTATETATAGVYKITLPGGLLQSGANTIAGTATASGNPSATTLTNFTLTYVPSLQNAYVVPGTIGSSQQLTFTYTSHESAFHDEVGFFKADDAEGTVNGLHPGDPGYIEAAMVRRQVLFSPTAAVGTSVNMTVSGGDNLVMYLVQKGTSTDLLATNPSDSLTGAGPTAFFGLTGANPDGVAHLAVADNDAASQANYGWEDMTGGGDRDYNDVVVNVRPTGDTPAALEVPAGPNRSVTVTTKLRPATKAKLHDTPTTTTTLGGEVGVIVADDSTGKIGTLSPGDAGYAAAALARAQVLFASGATAGTSATPTLTGGQFLIFYYVPGGTAAGVVSANPTNNPANGPVAFFSIPAANPDGATHFRSFDPEGITRDAPTANDPYWVHVMGTLNGTRADFDDAVFSVRFGS